MCDKIGTKWPGATRFGSWGRKPRNPLEPEVQKVRGGDETLVAGRELPALDGVANQRPGDTPDTGTQFDVRAWVEVHHEGSPVVDNIGNQGVAITRHPHHSNYNFMRPLSDAGAPTQVTCFYCYVSD